MCWTNLLRVAMRALLFLWSQFGPNPLPVVRAQIPTRDSTVGRALNVGATLNWHRPSTRGPFAHVRDRCADGPSQRRQATAFLGEVFGQLHAFTLAKRETYVNSVSRISIFRVLLSNSAHERY